MEINLINAFIWLKSLGKKTDEIDAKIASGVKSVAGRTGDVVLTKTDVGLSSVDNTTDAGKPISTATQTALNGKEPTLTLSALTAMTTWADTDLVLLDNAGTKKKMTVATLKSLLGASGGGIIESGSNANGSYIKYGDGTMICTKTYTNASIAVTTAFGGMFASALLNLGAFAETFYAIPRVSMSVTNDDGLSCTLFEAIRQSVSNAPQVLIVIPASLTANGNYIDVTAIGRWKA